MNEVSSQVVLVEVVEVKVSRVVVGNRFEVTQRASFDWALWPPQKEKDLGQNSVLILRDGTELPSGGSAIGYTPGLEKRSLCGREA